LRNPGGSSVRRVTDRAVISHGPAVVYVGEVDGIESVVRSTLLLNPDGGVERAGEQRYKEDADEDGGERPHILNLPQNRQRGNSVQVAGWLTARIFRDCVAFETESAKEVVKESGRDAADQDTIEGGYEKIVPFAVVGGRDPEDVA